MDIHRPPQIKRHYRWRRNACLALFLSLSLGACASSVQTPNPASQAGTSNGALTAARDAEVLSAQQSHMRNVEVTVTAPVKKILRDDTEGLPHQRFLIELSNGTTVLIAHDTAMAPHVPVQPGDVVTIHGEYIWNEKGGVIHWTHHTDTPRHEGGWIDFAGTRYQ